MEAAKLCLVLSVWLTLVQAEQQDVGRAKAKISVEEMLKLHRKRRDDDKLFSINSPRKNEAKQGQEIHIKLPTDISEQMKNQHDRTRFRDAISNLGFPSLDHPEVPDSNPFTPTESTIKTSTLNPTSVDFEPNSKIMHPKQARNWEEELTTDFTTFRPTSSPTTSKPRIEDQKVSTSPNEKWAIAWKAHVYFSGTLFVLLAIYCSVNILRLHTFSRLFSRGYFVSLNLCILILSLLRPIWLFHDPYNETLAWPRVAAYLLVDTGLPCMTSAFAVLFLALLQATQIELIAPNFQTPAKLFGFCLVHFGLTAAVDVTIGLHYNLRYMVLILQGVFIVWSLLLSAGYFYIFSAMNKVAMRQQGDLIRSVYPKLILEGGNGFNEATGQMQPLSSAVLKKPPLARAVHLTLGVAVLGSLLGGVQLFAMIKMLGLIKQDMSPNQNEWAWYGYQVSMRILEVTLCTLLAIIATTPLRSESNPVEASPGSTLDSEETFCCGNKSKNRRRKSNSATAAGLCCFGDSNPPREFEDEIYSEICSNNHSVRQVMGVESAAHNYHDGTIMALGTLNNPGGHAHHQTMLAMGSNTLMPYGHKRAPATYATQSATLLRSSNHSYNSGVFQPGSTTTQRTNSGGVPPPHTSSTSSRATLDTQLYSNIRSRPSSMLFNDSGFVRFRMGNEEPQLEMPPVPPPSNVSEDTKKKLRASQSFDEAVLQDEHPVHVGPSKSPIYHTTSDPDTKGDEDDDLEPELEAIYEPPPASRIVKKQSLTTPSESDEPQYSGQSLYGQRAPSQCSSISATQSFDLRMYGRLPKGVPIPSGVVATGTLKKTEETRERLENPYYYYGSTRNQKKAKMIQQKPRPLLPSQRAALEMQQRVPAFVSTQLPGERPKSRQQDPLPAQRPPSRPSSRQALLQQELQEQNFTRSRSLGGYYQGVAPPPQRNQQLRGVPNVPHHVGSMTPNSYSKWQHVHQHKPHNPLYDTPPTQRAIMRPQGLQMGEIRGVMGNASGSPLMNHLRVQGPQRSMLTEPVLSPILTDTEISPLHRTGMGSAPDYLTDPSDSDDADMITSQATQGYSEGLADNEQESEVSSIFGVDPPPIPDLPRNNESHISPLEYSAMLKLYRSAGIIESGRGKHLKDTTPDSGVVADNNNSNSNSNQSTSSSSNQKAPKTTGNSSQNSLLSSSSSTTEPVWQERHPSTNGHGGNQATSIQNQGKEYSRLEALNPDTVFSSSSSSSEAGDLPQRPSFRWDGTPLVDKTKESKLVKKVKSLDQAEQKMEENVPKPPKRESSVQKREEIK